MRAWCIGALSVEQAERSIKLLDLGVVLFQSQLTYVFDVVLAGPVSAPKTIHYMLINHIWASRLHIACSAISFLVRLAKAQT